MSKLIKIPFSQLSQANQRGVNQQQQQQQQQPYSPHAQMPSPIGQQNFQAQNNVAGNYNQQQQRVSPQSQFNSQLSPRQNYPQQGNGAAGASNWNTQQRLTVQNPMLNAQLTVSTFQYLSGRKRPSKPPTFAKSFAWPLFHYIHSRVFFCLKSQIWTVSNQIKMVQKVNCSDNFSQN